MIDGSNSDALSPNTTDPNDTTGAVYNTLSNFASLLTRVVSNYVFTFDVTAVSATIRIDNNLIVEHNLYISIILTGLVMHYYYLQERKNIMKQGMIMGHLYHFVVVIVCVQGLSGDGRNIKMDNDGK